MDNNFIEMRPQDYKTRMKDLIQTIKVKFFFKFSF
jgi:hypothetical protein